MSLVVVIDPPPSSGTPPGAIVKLPPPVWEIAIGLTVAMFPPVHTNPPVSPNDPGPSSAPPDRLRLVIVIAGASLSAPAEIVRVVPAAANEAPAVTVRIPPVSLIAAALVSNEPPEPSDAFPPARVAPAPVWTVAVPGKVTVPAVWVNAPGPLIVPARVPPPTLNPAPVGTVRVVPASVLSVPTVN